MTVKRERSEVFDAPLPRIMEAVRSVLAEGQANYAYRNTLEAEGGSRIDTWVVPRERLLLTTPMTIALAPNGSQTRVSVRTRSQWFILGDVFGFYHGYIHDLLWCVKRRVSPSPRGVTMVFSDFTLESVNRLLGVVTRAGDLFPDLHPVTPPPWLLETLARGGQGIQLSLLSEKSRSEFVVAPILLAGRELSGNRFAIYSGQRLDVDPEHGLTGECDFILSASEPLLPLPAPVATVVEAKKNDIEGGLGQCIAQMVAADRFNQAHERAGSPIFGCVTTGEAWQFARLAGSEALLEHRRYYIDDPGLILAAILAIIAQCQRIA